MPRRLCVVSPCMGEPVYRGRCERHVREWNAETHPNKRIYNSRKWKYTRRKQLHDHPLCAECGRIATDVDHIQRIEDGGDVWGEANLRSLCHSCHSVKTRREQIGAT